eukprot:3713055-Rhodomonas_salina.1
MLWLALSLQMYPGILVPGYSCPVLDMGQESGSLFPLESGKSVPFHRLPSYATTASKYSQAQRTPILAETWF